MTDFGLSDEYRVLDGLDQGEFGRIETSGSMTSFFATGAFVDNTIWVGNGQASTQHILNVASEFFFINDININNKKTVAIPINKRVEVPVLSINNQAIAIANPSPSLTKANSDVKFFSNMVLQKAVSNKQFSYLVLAVLQPIALHHPSLYRLKSFEQLQAECKVLCWALLNPLQYPVKLRVNTSNNFLADVIRIFLDNKLSLDNRLPCVFCSSGHFLMSLVLGDSLYFNVVRSLKIADVAYGDQFLDKNGLVAVVLALECIPGSVSVALYTDSQVAIDACVAELSLLQPDCHNSCWIERHHVVDLIKSKNLTVHWIKVRGHAGIAGNVVADTFAEQAAHSKVSLPARIDCRYVVANNRLVSGNAHYFVHDIFHSIYKFQWEVGPGQKVLSCLFGLVVDWNSTALVWHPDSYMLSGTVYFRLPVAIQKRLYNKNYPGVSCLFCGDVELPDHGFTYVKDASVQSDILGDFGGLWKTLISPDLLSPSFVLQDLSLGVSDVGLYSIFCKGFVLKSWMDEAIASLSDKKKAVFVVVDFVCHLVESHRTNLWLFRTKFRSDMERCGLIGDDIVVTNALGVDALPLSVGAVRLIGVLDSLDVSFGFRDRFLFFSGAVYRISVSISV
ncbi:hypothetical protein G9A89_006027 [Geosiphon pyriformis]|nr:hypothetical protein G9A89_006027 [Geosiphon pyriformis]